MNINEIFLSLQGESTFAGLPCIFIRFCGCNLDCSYCDTQYHHEINEQLTPAQILDRIKAYSPVTLVELTGGEPMIQEEIYDLIDLLISQSFQVMIESNGSILLDKVSPLVHKIIDVKCPDSGMGTSFLTANLSYFQKERDNLKFVISSYTDYEWAKAFLKHHNLSGSDILFSAVSSSVSIQSLAEWIIRDRLDVRFQLQMHKYIWSPETRGV